MLSITIKKGVCASAVPEIQRGIQDNYVPQLMTNIERAVLLAL